MQIAELRQHLGRSTPDIDPGIAIALLVLGRDSLTGTLATSLHSVLSRNLNRRFADMEFPDYPPETGVAVAERIATQAITLGAENDRRGRQGQTVFPAHKCCRQHGEQTASVRHGRPFLPRPARFARHLEPHDADVARFLGYRYIGCRGIRTEYDVHIATLFADWTKPMSDKVENELRAMLDELGLAEIDDGQDVVFADLDLDSLTVMDLCVALEDRYDFAIDPGDVIQQATLTQSCAFHRDQTP